MKRPRTLTISIEEGKVESVVGSHFMKGKALSRKLSKYLVKLTSSDAK